MANADFSANSPSHSENSDDLESNGSPPHTDVVSSDKKKKRPPKKRLFVPVEEGPMARFRRKDKFRLPPRGTKWKWVPTEEKRLVLMKDHALAATNSVKKYGKATTYSKVPVLSTQVLGG